MKILIEEKSIRINPNAGQTEFAIARPSVITISVGEKSFTYDHMPSQEVIQKLHEKYNETVVIKHDRPIERMTSLFPDPKYFYNHKTTKVTCRGCERTFKHTLLKSDTIYLGDDEAYNDEICPYCELWNCVTGGPLEYQDIKEVIHDNQV